jgi:hypothetical protein
VLTGSVFPFAHILLKRRENAVPQILEEHARPFFEAGGAYRQVTAKDGRPAARSGLSMRV